MELKQYDYTKDPYTSSKAYDVFPLSKDGFTQYIGNDSYTHRYIKNKFDSKILEKIYGTNDFTNLKTQQNFHSSANKFNPNNENFEMQKNKINYNENYTEPNKDKVNDIYGKNKNENSENKNLETLKKDLLPKNLNSNNNINNKESKNGFAQNFEKIKEISFNDKLYLDENNNNINDDKDDIRSQSKRNCYSSYNKVANKKAEIMSKTFYSKNSAFNISNKKNYPDNNNNYNNSKSNNLLKFLSIKKQFNKKKNLNNDNTRWEKDYVSNIEYLKKNQNLFFDIDPNEENINYLRKKKYDGFESFNIPRLENINVDASKPAFQYTQRLVKSCIGKRKENATNNNFLNFINNNFNDKNEAEQSNQVKVVEKIKEENEKLKNILNMQTNKDFLNRGNMPKISYVASQPKLVIKKFGLGGQGKFLGGKFNPDNFQTGRGNDRNRRNYVGGLYSN